MSGKYIPKYLSAVRQMQVTWNGKDVPHYGYLDMVVRVYRSWKEVNYPRDDVRCGVSADHMKRVWSLGIV